MSSEHVLAIDFGTTNTYYSKCPGDQMTPQGVDFGNARDGLATAILYRGNRPALTGHTALEEYGEATSQERASYTLRTHFKPEIATGREARKNAVDFLAGTLEAARGQRIDIEPAERQVIVGVPSEAPAGYRESLAAVAREAGYGEISMVDEPKGALFYHLFHRAIPARDAQRGILVIDFGGGTCDFAFMERGHVRHSWGDMHLGGRLFDDLFFQWFLDENPDALTAIREDGSEFFVQTCCCREVKEYFSTTMARDRTGKIPRRVGAFGRITGMTWEGFLQRASCYSPSASFRQFLRDIGDSDRITRFDNGPVDLIESFRTCLLSGLRDEQIDGRAVHCVILTGGSSQWPFVTDIVQKELGVDGGQIVRSDRPHAAISVGLSVLPALQLQYRTAQKQLTSELPHFCDNQVKVLLEKRFQDISGKIADAITEELFDRRIKPVLQEFSDQGGSVASLEERIARKARAFEPRCRKIVEQEFTVLKQALPLAVRELAEEWFADHNLCAPDLNVEVEGGYAIDTETFSLNSVDVYNNSKHRIMWIIRPVLRGVTALLAILYLKERAKQKARHIKLYTWIWKQLLTDGTIDGMRKEFRRHAEADIRQKLPEKQEALSTAVQDQVQRDIDAVSEIDRMGWMQRSRDLVGSA